MNEREEKRREEKRRERRKERREEKSREYMHVLHVLGTVEGVVSVLHYLQLQREVQCFN